MRLTSKYFLAFAGLATTGFLGFALANAITNYRENVSRVTEFQQQEGKVIAVRIGSYLDSIAAQLHEVNALPWASGLLGLTDERSELHRLLKLNPAIHAIRSIGADGLERNLVSRTTPDRIGSATPAQAERSLAKPGTTYGPAYFMEGSTPFVSIEVTDSDANSPLLIAEVSLRYVADLVAATNIGEGGRAYVVDGTDQLVAHPNLSLVHRKVNLGALEQVKLTHTGAGLRGPISIFAQSPETGKEVLTSAVTLTPLAWTLFVEQPVDEVLRPVRASLYRTLWLLALLLLVGLAMSQWLAKRLTRPIVALHEGAKKIEGGDLSVRIPIHGGDELGALAREFNSMAQRLDASYGDLEAKVTARTQALAAATDRLRTQAIALTSLNQQLEQSVTELGAKKEEAERANVAKTRFLAAASHDLRQPMQAISLLVEILRERVSRDDIASLVDKVQLSVQALEGLFISLLDVSRLDAGAVRPKLVEFRVSSLFALLESNFLPVAVHRGIDLRIVKCSAIILSDPALLERIVGNFVANAIRYTASGRIVVGCRRRGETLRIQVIDTGPGIAEHLHQDIFEEFFQLPRSDHDGAQGLGLGLGLSIVKRTAEILSHALLLESRLGCGSTFGVEVPMVASGPSTALATQSIEEEQADVAGIFVLVIDDDTENCYAIETLCAQWGCHVVSGNSAEAALRSLQTHLRIPDLIVTDYRLGGGMTGIDALRLVRAKLDDTLPAIIMTGDLSVLASDLAGVSLATLLYKPINARSLRQAAHRLVTRSAPARVITAG